MATSFHLTVLTPEKSVLDQNVTYVSAPGIAGYFGVLAHHAALIAALKPGQFTVRDAGGTETNYAVSGGFFEVSENKAVVLADALEIIEDIDVDRAKSAEKRARELLEKAAHDRQIDKARAEAALRRAMARVSLARH